MAEVGTVNRILHDARSGDREVVDRIVPLLYEEVRRIARSQRRRGARGPRELLRRGEGAGEPGGGGG